MIKFTAMQKNDRVLLGIGLSHKNVEQLMLGRPVNIWGQEVSLPCDILIFVDKDEQTMADKLKKHGMVKDATLVDDRSKKKATRQ